MSAYTFVLFGATGDLAALKLFPALYRVAQRDDAAAVDVVGVGRTEWDDAALRDAAVEALVETRVDEGAARAWADQTLRYARVEGYDDLGAVFEAVEAIERARGGDANRVYYLSLPPSTFPDMIRALGAHEAERGTTGEPASGDAPWVRLVIEKPFGTDLASAQELNAIVHDAFREEQVFRIDHYLGKETVQNLLVFRFANTLFQQSWRRELVERVEITVAETNDAEGRAGYFDGVGTVRDMIQNHLMQLFALTAMEPPARLDAQGIRREKIKVLQSTRAVDPDEAVLGQYGAGDGQEAYAEHEGVEEGSETETFAAVTLHVDSWRWQGVPFVLRTGKRLAERLTEIAVVFRRPPVALFDGQGGCEPQPNVLRIRLQPDEGFELGFDVKTPGDGFSVTTQHLDFAYAEAFGELPDAYETLLHDVARGDATLFVHADEAEEAWRLVTPILDWSGEVHRYPSGSWGPAAAADLVTLQPPSVDDATC